MGKKISEIECLVCNGIHFRKGNFKAQYERYDEYVRMNENSEAEIKFFLESEEENPLTRIPEQSNVYSYICEECGFIMSFNKEKRVESKKQERGRKQKERMYDWTKFKNI
ncbi:hypothetical protein RCG17_16965 [Neobacillus sp. PS3-12]|uniref:hypothetical protein n=1 Tax=Neobacillus sp. PS3-12 TaxID=3070677 RepID=UPI0027E0B0B3|nr:hypothetical protein [Neobacillus sp. PS3-12]WML51175.1 hypothetical protein RCG17_16965 [Neobacillus sp. PS3-12]